MEGPTEPAEPQNIVVIDDAEPAPLDAQNSASRYTLYAFRRAPAVTRQQLAQLRKNYTVWLRKHVPAVRFRAVNAPAEVRDAAFDAIAKVLAEIAREVRS
jgi:hypothetical protein